MKKILLLLLTTRAVLATPQTDLQQSDTLVLKKGWRGPNF